MKKNIICLGLGPNQLKLIKHLSNKYNIIGIDRKLSLEAKKIISIYYNSSIYDLKKIQIISKQIKDKKINIESIIYRSSGPVILAANFLEKSFGIKRINSSLRDCIYSKSFFYKYLKKFNINALKSKKILSYSKLNNKHGVIKPDASIKGKKNIFKITRNSFFSNFNLCKKESHNHTVNFSNFYDGVDISTFYLVNNNKKMIFLISHVQEFNKFNNKKIYSYGSCAPPVYNEKKIIKEKEKIDRKIIKLYSEFYGIISISSKITNSKNILPYEINIGLSGDKFADEIFPYIYKNRSLYQIELDMALFKTKKNTINPSGKFIGFFDEKKFFSKKYFLKQINKI
jgi:hypothetical protein